jgi:hypothetical protein
MHKRRVRIDALLRHLDNGHDPQDFAGTRYEQLALIRTACRFRLVKWQEERGRYELTSIGRLHVAPRCFGSMSLTAGTAVGATIGAVALALLWPTDPSSRRVDDQTPSSIAAPVSRLGDAGVGEPVARQISNPVQGSDPTVVATKIDGPVAEQPSAETASIVLKPTPVKTSHRTTGGAPSTRNFANSYRDERYASPGPIFR